MQIVIAIAILGGLGLVFGLVLAAASKIFYVESDPRLDQLNECLPGANCGGCGYAGCGAYAEAVLKGEAPIGKCSLRRQRGGAGHGGHHGRQGGSRHP
ncbi:MAG: RnfABCDGE type electron transport complex subunit B [Oscillospiraceae bacterium]